MDCCLTGPSHFLKQCWLFNKSVLGHSPEGTVTRTSLDLNPLHVFGDYPSKITTTSPSGQRVNLTSKHQLSAHEKRHFSLHISWFSISINYCFITDIYLLLPFCTLYRVITVTVSPPCFNYGQIGVIMILHCQIYHIENIYHNKTFTKYIAVFG